MKEVGTMKIITIGWRQLGGLVILLISGMQLCADAFDPLDPNGNITIKWDVMSWTPDGYMATVTMFNWQQYRHIDLPGWKLSWAWGGGEMIWAMVGAQTTFQGDCSQFQTDPLPHCCDKKPIVIDLLPTAVPSLQVANCCRGGVLASFGQDATNAVAAFQVKVGQAGTTNTSVVLPYNFTILTPSGPGYSCSQAVQVKKSLFPADDGRRFTEAFMTWNVACRYVQALAQQAPNCCVAFSAFYNNTIVPCPECSCACVSDLTSVASSPAASDSSHRMCVDTSTPYSRITPALSSGTKYCTRDMCPVKVHWHVKTNYRDYWRVKVTVTNRDFTKNFTNWNLVAQHPNFDNFTEAFSFNYKALNPYGTHTNDSAMLWGIKFYNDLLIHAGPDGNVQSEILFRKGTDFTLSNGWPFPKHIYFNGDICVLPAPQDFPSLPSHGPSFRKEFDPVSVLLLVVGGCILLSLDI